MDSAFAYTYLALHDKVEKFVDESEIVSWPQSVPECNKEKRQE